MVDSSVTVNNINQLRAEDRVVHDWYRFVLSFPPHLVQQYLDSFEAKPGQFVLDPFCGTGTTIVEAKRFGYKALGLEAHPMTHFASCTKSSWDVDHRALTQHSLQIAGQVRERFEQQNLDIYNDLPLFSNAEDIVELRTLNSARLKLLLSDSISPRPLHRALELLDSIRRERHPWTLHQELALASTLVADASNLRFGPEVGVSRKKKTDADVIRFWMSRVDQMAADLQQVAECSHLPSHVFHGDARAALPFRPNSVQYVITSPPYPNEKDYTRTTRLESVVLGFINNREELRRVKHGLLRSNTRNVYVADEDDRLGNQFESVRCIAEEIESKRIALGKTSGFERLYHRVVSLYFGGMFRHFEALKTVLAPGALCAYVVGDQESFFRTTIPTGQLLAQIAEYCGYKVERIDLWRTRLSTATKSQLREEVLVLRWPG